MTRFMVKCHSCEGEFVFSHPSVYSVDRLMRLAIDCPHCADRIAMDPTLSKPILKVAMLPIEKIQAKLKAEGWVHTEAEILPFPRGGRE